jgi:Tfp pilus assembly protein FimT
MNRLLRAFTTSELLIALVITGLLASFATPKIYQNFQEIDERTSFREIVSVMQRLYYEGASKGYRGGKLNRYVMDHVHAAKVCTNVTAQGCTFMGNNQWGGYGIEDSGNLAGFDMHSGAFVNGINLNPTDPRDEFVIDINGGDEGGYDTITADGNPSVIDPAKSSRLMDRLVMYVCLDQGCANPAISSDLRNSRELIGLVEVRNNPAQKYRFDELMGGVVN